MQRAETLRTKKQKQGKSIPPEKQATCPDHGTLRENREKGNTKFDISVQVQPAVMYMKFVKGEKIQGRLGRSSLT
jgi:hypothetical protein